MRKLLEEKREFFDMEKIYFQKKENRKIIFWKNTNQFNSMSSLFIV